MDQDVSNLFMALVEVGRVRAVRQEYEVFRSAGGDFVVFSPSSRGSSSFHMTRVPAENVEALRKMLTSDGVTTGSLMKDERLEEVFGSDEKVAKRFDLLMALYVLTALGKAEMKKSGRILVFSKRRNDD
ncbi:MAG TPA: hypothetical protein VK126_06415 [Nitrososphaerales archaeon]|nr:hypothetical protein [Nitrososphaerales archaeon]